MPARQVLYSFLCVTDSRLASHPGSFPVSASHLSIGMLEMEMCITMPGFFMGSGGWGPDSQDLDSKCFDPLSHQPLVVVVVVLRTRSCWVNQASPEFTVAQASQELTAVVLPQPLDARVTGVQLSSPAYLLPFFFFETRSHLVQAGLKLSV